MKDKVFFFIKLAVVLVVAAEIVYGLYDERQRKAIQAMPAYFIYDSSHGTRVSFFGALADSNNYAQNPADAFVLNPTTAVVVDSYTPGGRFAHFYAFKPWKSSRNRDVRFEGYVLTVFLHKNAQFIPLQPGQYPFPQD